MKATIEYKCPFFDSQKEISHDLLDMYKELNRISCSCGFSGPLFYFNPNQSSIELKQVNSKINLMETLKKLFNTKNK